MPRVTAQHEHEVRERIVRASWASASDFYYVSDGKIRKRTLAAGQPETIEFGKRLADVKLDGAGAHLIFADGSAADADVVVGADGVNSKENPATKMEENATYFCLGCRRFSPTVMNLPSSLARTASSSVRASGKWR